MNRVVLHLFYITFVIAFEIPILNPVLTNAKICTSQEQFIWSKVD